MSKRILVVLVLSIGLLAGCALPSFTAVVGSGDPVTRTFELADFDTVKIGSSFDAEVIASDDFFVEVSVDDNLEQYLLVEQQGNMLTIGLQPNIGVARPTLRARVTLPVLAGLEANGASHVDVTGFESGDRMRIDASGASTVRGDLVTDDLDTDVAGASTLEIEGQAEALRATASGASTIDLGGFTVTDADVDANGASTILVNVSGRLDAQASGASNVRYTGDPTLGRIEATGASSISPQ
jgi:hypothetical protein